MLSTGRPPDWETVDIAVPRRSNRLPGISMAGFRQSLPAPVDIAMVAHPSVTLLIDLSEGDGIVCDSRGRRERGSVVIGLMPGDLRAGGRVGECLQIRLEPDVAAAVLDAAPDLSGTMAPLADVWGRDAERIEDRLRAAESWDERFRIAAEVVGQRMRARTPVEPGVAHTWRRTLTSRGRIQVDSLAGEVGWDRKRLWSRFRSQLGISPKRAIRLVRFDHAAHLLATGHPAAGVAAECGYVDQSHLHREVKAFTGLTPSVVAAAPWLAIDDVAWPTSSPVLARTGPAPAEVRPVPPRRFDRPSAVRPWSGRR
ncbi:helix-turn-helix domain-containing protein [Amycolatopsis sp. WAC 01416]|uniref:AraC family transcriptional regulator n=1 Tax=Amycolatopsis sp. WAC 01416 TaxID=2203196 RepID=UPI001F29F3F0|nr:helix-turn-helix domain-containing protein [Amycolatopsis sp. WAC 01416]